MQRTIIGIAILSLSAIAAVAGYCLTHGIYSPSDFHNYRSMRSWDHPVLSALNKETLSLGSSERELFGISEPIWTTDYGRYRIHGYAPENSYSSLSIGVLDGRLVSAGAGSCTWRWSFFHDVPEDIIWCRHALDTYREIVARDPDKRDVLKPCFDHVHRVLGIAWNDGGDSG